MGPVNVFSFIQLSNFRGIPFLPAFFPVKKFFKNFFKNLLTIPYIHDNIS